MLKVLQLLLCAILFATPTFAQDKKFKAKYGKISDEELAIKTYKDDPGAPALVWRAPPEQRADG